MVRDAAAFFARSNHLAANRLPAKGIWLVRSSSATSLARAGPQAVNSLKLRMDPSLKANQKNSNAVVPHEDEASLGMANLC